MRIESQKLQRWSTALMVGATIMCLSSPAFAIAGLDSLGAKVDEFNTALITIGGALAVTGFLRAVLAAFFGRGNLASAGMMLGLGLAAASAKQIVGFFIPGVGG